MNLMNHKGYTARIEYSDEDECFVGHVAGIKDVIGFHGDSVAVLHESFVEAVEDYLRTCESVGREPNRPYSGQFRLRLDPALHARAAIEAERKGKSLNAWVTEVIQNQVSI
jgi:predicted HicB family RNase H-like nuclease